MPAIELQSLHKQFGDITALRGIDLTVEEGEVFGFLGPNGAGKSTTIDLVLDYLRPTTGDVRVFGMDAQTQTKQIRRRIGVLPDAYHLDEHLMPASTSSSPSTRSPPLTRHTRSLTASI